jgi:hypothetical protein
MRTRLALYIALTWLLTATCRPCYPATPADHRALLAAIRQVESGNDSGKIGDKGLARGAYQIHESYWRDGCKAGGVKWDYLANVTDNARCEYVMHHYWQKYGAVTDEDKARCHNAGSNWRRNLRATYGYWRKVKEAMK